MGIFAAQMKNTRVVDLTPRIPVDIEFYDREYSDYNYSCGCLWAPIDNRVAAEVIIEIVYGQAKPTD